MTFLSRQRVTLCDACGRAAHRCMTSSSITGCPPGGPLRTAILAFALAAAPLAAQAEPAVTIPPPAAEAPAQNSGLGSGLETAVLAGGCFWGIQAVFQHVKGVTSAVSGYAGGAPRRRITRPSARGRTGHAEAVQVTYDPAQVSYGQLLQSSSRSPTTRRAQPPGSRHRHAVSLGHFSADDDQKRVAERLHRAARAAKACSRPIVTQVVRSGLLPGRGLSPGLRGRAPQPALHRLQRRAQGREPEEDVSGRMARSAGAGDAGGKDELTANRQK